MCISSYCAAVMLAAVKAAAAPNVQAQSQVGAATEEEETGALAASERQAVIVQSVQLLRLAICQRALLFRPSRLCRALFRQPHSVPP